MIKRMMLAVLLFLSPIGLLAQQWSKDPIADHMLQAMHDYEVSQTRSSLDGLLQS